MTRWAMLADLDRCVGCQTCTAACRHANATSPAVQWRKVLDIESGSYPDVRRTFVPVGCQHCDDPPCMHVCPSTATRKRPDGIVTIDYDLCIGCAYCDVACPYQARFKIDAPSFAYGKTATANELEREDPAMIGVAQKCTFCVSRVDAGLARGLVPGSDPEATPACVNACIASALHFGDVDDPASNVSHLLSEQPHFRMHEEVGTGPRFYYLSSTAPGSEPGEAGQEPAWETGSAGGLRTQGVEPTHQRHWDWKAAGNFMCGGAGAGLFGFVAIAAWLGSPNFVLGASALALMAAGLTLVLAKIGRPWRALNVLRQPQRSWMAREAWIAAVFFPLAAFAIWFADLAATAGAAGFGLLFLYAQAAILKEAKGIPAWREPRIVPLIVTTGLAEGAGLFLAAIPLFATLKPMSEGVALVVILFAVARALAWRAYSGALEKAGAPAGTLDCIASLRPWLLVLGLVLPVVLIALGFVAGPLSSTLFALGGISTFAAGWLLKLRLITRAAYNQGFALKRVPARGRRLAAVTVKPGWLMPRETGQPVPRKREIRL